MHLLLVVILMSCAFALGYRGAIDEVAQMKEKELLRELIESQNKPPAKSLSYAISVVADEKMRTQNPNTHHQEPSTIERALDQIPLTPHESDLWHALGNSSSAAQIRRLLIARNHESELPGTDLFVKNANEDLLKDKNASLDAIEDSLKSIPNVGFPMERVALLSMMDQVGGTSDATKEQSLNELTTNVIPSRPNPLTTQNQEELNAALSTTPEMTLPLAAQLIFFKNTSDPTEALNGTVQGILAQPDRGVQISLAAQFIAAYPSMKGTLISNLVNQGIQLHLEGLQ